MNTDLKCEGARRLARHRRMICARTAAAIEFSPVEALALARDNITRSSSSFATEWGDVLSRGVISEICALLRDPTDETEQMRISQPFSGLLGVQELSEISRVVYGPTIADVATSETAEELSFAIRNFLDAFYAYPESNRLAEEPRRLTEVLRDDGLADAYLAGIAEHLADQFGVRKPSWSDSPDRVMKEPWYAMKSPGGRMVMLAESPTAFRKRNIFVSANALHRA
jgi:hypothetical protein